MPIKKNKQDAAVVKELKDLAKIVYDASSEIQRMLKGPDKLTHKCAIWEERTTDGITENRVIELYLINTKIDVFPESIGQLSELELLSCYRAFSENLSPTQIPSSIVGLRKLKSFFLKSASEAVGIDFTDAFEKLSQLPLLVNLDIRDNSIKEVPETLSKLSNLQYLNLSGNSLKEVPETLSKLSNLQYLNLSGNSLNEVPETLSKLSNLQYLNLSDNELSDIPDSFTKMTKLECLELSTNTGASNVGNPITNTTQEKINKLLPNVEIQWSGPGMYGSKEMNILGHLDKNRPSYMQ